MRATNVMRRAVAAAAVALLLAACSNGGTDQEGPAAPATSEPATAAATPEVTETPGPDALSAFWHVETPPQDTLVSADGGCTPFTGHNVTDDRLRSLRDGDQVRIEDAAGSVVAIGELYRRTNDADGCAWGFLIEDVPAGGTFYTATIGDWESAVLAEDDVTAGMLLFEFTP